MKYAIHADSKKFVLSVINWNNERNIHTVESTRYVEKVMPSTRSIEGSGNDLRMVILGLRPMEAYWTRLEPNSVCYTTHYHFDARKTLV